VSLKGAVRYYAVTDGSNGGMIMIRKNRSTPHATLFIRNITRFQFAYTCVKAGSLRTTREAPALHLCSLSLSHLGFQSVAASRVGSYFKTLDTLHVNLNFAVLWMLEHLTDHATKSWKTRFYHQTDDVEDGAPKLPVLIVICDTQWGDSRVLWAACLHL